MNSRALRLVPALLLAACGGGGGGTAPTPPEPDPGITSPTTVAARSIAFRVSDENGVPVAGAEIVMDQMSVLTDAAGRAELSAPGGPALVVVRAESHLQMPVAIGRDDNSVEVRLWSNPAGTRWSYHAAGDVMLARRYLAPESGTPRLRAGRIGEDAEALVARVAPLFRAADVKSLNFESASTQRPESDAYPGKRFVLNTPPQALAGVTALDPDVLILANNHIRDYLDDGIADTLAELDSRGLRWVGATPSGDIPAQTPLILEVAGLRVGFYALTTLSGSFVNDAYPLDEDPVPSALAPEDAFQYEFRSWGFRGPNINVPERERRIGSAWRRYRITEETLPEDEKPEAWASLTSVYPELQDYVAQRGHGGAARRLRADAATDIAALAAEVDVVIASIHGGFPYQPVRSAAVTRLARDMIDAGASVVAAHHPHVLQGAEYYNGGLIAYSLGNFIFDQDRLASFSTAVLRVVFDGNQMLEASFLPVEIVDYQPLPATDEAADLTLQRVWERSVMIAYADSGSEGGSRVFVSSTAEGSAPAQVLRDGERGVLAIERPDLEPVALSLEPGRITPLGYRGLVDMDLSDPESDAIEIGRELYGWGHFEDTVADGLSAAGTHLFLTSENEKVVVGDAHSGERFLRLRRAADSSEIVLARSLARIDLIEHRFYRNDGGADQPDDPPARYTLRAAARMTGAGRAFLRADLYNIDSGELNEATRSDLLEELSWDLDLAPDTGWSIVEIEIPREAVVVSGVRANAILLYFGLERIGPGEVLFDLDDLELIEWRQANAQPNARFGDFRYARSTADETVDLQFNGVPERTFTP